MKNTNEMKNTNTNVVIQYFWDAQEVFQQRQHDILLNWMVQKVSSVFMLDKQTGEEYVFGCTYFSVLNISP